MDQSQSYINDMIHNMSWHESAFVQATDMYSVSQAIRCLIIENEPSEVTAVKNKK